MTETANNFGEERGGGGKSLTGKQKSKRGGPTPRAIATKIFRNTPKLVKQGSRKNFCCQRKMVENVSVNKVSSRGGQKQKLCAKVKTPRKCCIYTGGNKSGLVPCQKDCHYIMRVHKKCGYVMHSARFRCRNVCVVNQVTAEGRICPGYRPVESLANQSAPKSWPAHRLKPTSERARSTLKPDQSTSEKTRRDNKTDKPTNGSVRSNIKIDDPLYVPSSVQPTTYMFACAHESAGQLFCTERRTYENVGTDVMYIVIDRKGRIISGERTLIFSDFGCKENRMLFSVLFQYFWLFVWEKFSVYLKSLAINFVFPGVCFWVESEESGSQPNLVLGNFVQAPSILLFVFGQRGTEFLCGKIYGHRMFVNFATFCKCGHEISAEVIYIVYIFGFEENWILIFACFQNFQTSVGEELLTKAESLDFYFALAMLWFMYLLEGSRLEAGPMSGIFIQVMYDVLFVFGQSCNDFLFKNFHGHNQFANLDFHICRNLQLQNYGSPHSFLPCIEVCFLPVLGLICFYSHVWFLMDAAKSDIAGLGGSERGQRVAEKGMSVTPPGSERDPTCARSPVTQEQNRHRTPPQPQLEQQSLSVSLDPSSVESGAAYALEESTVAPERGDPVESGEEYVPKESTIAIENSNPVEGGAEYAPKNSTIASEEENDVGFQRPLDYCVKNDNGRDESPNDMDSTDVCIWLDAEADELEKALARSCA